jgi:preprotein translocase subunit SecB
MNTLPTSGYRLDRVFAQEQTFIGYPNSEQFPASDGQPRATVGLDWRLVDEFQFTVVITLAIDPTRERPESIRVMMHGVFTRVGDSPTVPVMAFIQGHAPAILMPYVREAISSLTGRGYYGAMNLPPINVAMLMGNVDMEATTGMREARANPRLGAAFGALGPVVGKALPSG